MRALPIRARLAAWYFVIMAAALAIFAVFALGTMRRSIYTTVDEQLEDRGRVLQALIARTDSSDVAKVLHNVADLQSSSQLFQVLDRSGQLVYRSVEMQRMATPNSALGLSHLEDAQIGDVPVRVLTVPASSGSHQFSVQVAEPMDDYLEAIDRFSGAMWVGIPILLLFAALGGYCLSAFALRPVDRITRAAQTITPQDLSRRLAVPRSGDELQRLAETLNSMLDRIDSAMTRITQFTADASHELRTPMALIRTRAEVTLGQPRSKEQYEDALKEVLAESERVSCLIENLMLLARADTGAEALNFQTVDLATIARAVSLQAQTLAETKQIDWKAAVPETSVLVRGDPTALRRLLLILIDNAMKYTATGGSVYLDLRRNSHGVEISVRDTGVGISNADLPHIFERFYRADKTRSREQGGTGLGLSIGRWIASAHGGQIEAESSESGSTFTIHLPITGEASLQHSSANLEISGLR